MKRSSIMMSALLFVTAMLLSGCIFPYWDDYDGYRGGYRGGHGGYHGGRYHDHGGGYYDYGGRR